MGYVTCPPRNHPRLHGGEVRCCWRCDRCPMEFGFRLQPGDYCPDCVAIIKAGGGVWSEFHQDYVKEEDHDERDQT